MRSTFINFKHFTLKLFLHLSYFSVILLSNYVHFDFNHFILKPLHFDFIQVQIITSQTLHSISIAICLKVIIHTNMFQDIFEFDHLSINKNLFCLPNSPVNSDNGTLLYVKSRKSNVVRILSLQIF